jgi:hypothetical protein
MRLRDLLGLGATALTLGATAPAAATTLGFECISNHQPVACGIGETQISVDVTDAGSSRVDFTFHNAGPAMSSVTDIYWDEVALFSFDSLFNFPGVEFDRFASPADLPDWENASPAFRANARLSVDADAPVSEFGINPGEMLVVRFSLRLGKTFERVLQDLADGTLRVGVRVQGFDPALMCADVSLVSLPTGPMIPEPGTFGLVSLGLLGVATARRSRERALERFSTRTATA